ncbi:PREDICTED: 4-coumarate--CoA ligase 2-like isoform X2 [Dufourea novaeangliae]|uniref:4-coumarate--CoA ligase 2-like isoform X2 n=1 Tax=Dufourea novaeangliae TaxID=178035 RepID=UPI0007675D3E|nr:PREDICTED: 4-coumarate--CoA ligase 2-like isoform X2 [Dufourea novaeangliae]
MTSVRQVLRCARRRLGQLTSESGTKHLNRSVRCASTQAQHEMVDNGNGKKIFTSPYGEYTPSEMFVHEYVWKNVENHGNLTALVCSVTGRKYTYSQARDAANYIGRSLLNIGLRKGDTVALIAPNYPESVLAFLGILEAELIVTTVNPFYTPYEISRQLKSSGAAAIIAVTEIAGNALEAAKGNLPPGASVIVIDDGTGSSPEGTIPFMDLITRGKSLPPIKHGAVSVNDVAVLPYSSGTTGMPKGVMLTHKNLVSNMEMTEMTVDERMWKTSSATFQEVMPLILPFFHIFGMNGLTLPRLARGTQIITVPKFVPEQFIQLLANHKMTGMYLVPPLLLFFNASPFVKKEHLENMHHAVIGAAPMAKDDFRRFYDKFQLNQDNMKFCQGYGLTETSPVCCFEVSGTKPGSIGKTIPGCEVRVVDPTTNKDVARPGETGEIWIKGPHVMKGYYNNEAATQSMIVEDGWLKTGDIGHYDEEYDFYITDRLKELIKVKGFQVAPAELEALLRSHPGVVEAGVVGVPDARCGEVPKAFIVPKKGSNPTVESIQNFVKGKVSDYKELKGTLGFCVG